MEDNTKTFDNLTKNADAPAGFSYMQFKEILKKFGNSKGIRYERAGVNYPRYVEYFFNYVKKDLVDIDNDDIVSYQSYMKTKYSDRTRALYSTALREFFKFANNRGLTKVIREEITINKIFAKVQPHVAQHEAAMLCDITEGDDVKKLAVKILWLCGPRVTELVTLRKDMVNLVEKGATIRNLKHYDQESTKFITWDDETNELIKKVMGENESEWVFYSKQSKSHLNVRQIQRWFVEFRERLGITKKITPHAARRGWVKDNLAIGMPLPHLQQMGGWESLDSLQKYTKHLDNDIKDIAQEAMRKRTALAKQKELFKDIEKELIKKDI